MKVFLKEKTVNKVKGSVFIGLFLLGVFALSMGVTDDHSSYTRIMMHELEKENKIDYLCIGASRVYRGIDPEILDHELGIRTFNAGSSSQRPEDTYFLLKAILEKRKVETVIYDINYGSFQQYPGDSTIRTHIVLDYMPFGINKIDYAKKVLGDTVYSLTTVSNILRYKEQWKTPQKMLHNLYMHLKDDAYKNFEYSNADNITEWYCGRGFVFSKAISNGEPYPLVPWNETELYPNQLDFFDKIIDLCQQHESRLLCISMPVQKSYLEREPRYDEIYDFFKKRCNERGVPYLDLNQMNFKDMGLSNTDYKDEVHLNGYGAEKVSCVLSQYLLYGEPYNE